MQSRKLKSLNPISRKRVDFPGAASRFLQYALVFIALLGSRAGLGQESITTGAATTQNYNAMGTSATASLPSAWRMGTDWTTGTTATTQAAGTSGTGILNGTSAGGFYNFANGVTGSSTDRAIGFLTSSVYASPRSIMYAFTNNTGNTVTSISISWNYEKYRSGSRAFDWTFFHGSTSAALTANASGDQSYAADANNTTVSNPPTSISKSFTITGLSIPNGSTYYLRWTLTGVGGSTNAQGLAIDDFSITLSASTYTVTFNGNNETGGSMSNQTASIATALTSNAFTRSGYTFAGWNTAANGSGTAYANGASYPFTANATLYAQWTANTLTVSYDSQGGSAITAGSTTTGGSIAASPGTPTRAGYTFNGWFAASSGGSAITFPYTHGQTASFTLYAQWTANTLTVTYDSQGGSAIAAGSTTTGGSIAASAGTPTRAGYTFNGWFAASTGGSAITFPYTHGQTASFTLYAQWTANTLTVTYDTQGGSAVAAGSTTTGGTLANPGNPTLAGNTFNGWFLAASGGAAITFPYTHGQTSNFTLYAQWSVAGSPVLNGLTLGSSLSTTYGTASTGISFIPSGTFLSGNITATAQTGFEVSTSSGSGYGASVSVASGTTVWIRFAALQNAGSYNGVVAAVLSSSGASSVNVLTSASGNIVSPKALSITASSIASKVYDGTTTAGAVTVGTLSGFVGSETITATGVAASYSSANAGTYAGVTITYTLSNGTNGGLAANYSLANGSASGVITPKALSISAPSIASKVYDATTTAGTVTAGTLSGLVGAETLTVTGAAANYSSANTGTYPGVVITYTLSNGTGLASNYSLANGSAAGIITTKALSISAPTIASKVYDATTTAGAVTVGTLTGFVGSQTVTVTGASANYSSANAGTYAGVVITYTLSNGTNGGLAANYSLANGSATGVITPKALTITAPTIASKVYNATTSAGAVTVGTLSGFVGSETVTATATAVNYSSADVGTYNNVTVNYTLANGTNGGLAINYSLTSGTATGVITQQPLTITANNATKEISQIITGGAGSTAFTSSGLQGGQTIGSVTVAYGAAAGSTGQGATAGTYTGQVTASAATGGTFNAANYSITYVVGDIIVTNPNAMLLTTFGTAVCENFSGLATSGTSSTMPTGWSFVETGTNANTTYTAGTGSGAAGETYSFGTAGDRTLGGLRSGTLNPSYGARIYNNTGSTLSTMTIAYTGKTWRVGASNRSDRIDFQYSNDATAINNGTWTDENNLDYANPGQASTASGSVIHSSNISFTLQGLSIAPGASFWIRWNDFDATGSDDGMGVDDVCVTPIIPCTAPDLLAFVAQPSSVLQDATMSTVTVKAYCSSTGFTATSYTGNITLSASGGGCGYVSQTVAAVNGVATFSNVVFTRSAQSGITLTATASGITADTSNTFNVSAPAGSATVVAQHDFGANTSLSYTTTVGGLGVFNTSNTSGESNTNGLAFYYDACLTGASGSTSTATFSQSSGLSTLSNATLSFSMAWVGTQLAGASCDASSFSGLGLDQDDFVRLETRINGGAYATTFQLNGNSNKLIPFSTSGVSVPYNANQTLNSSTEPSAFTIALPSGTNSVDFRFTFKTNRRNEIIILDNLVLSGFAAGAPLALPVANAGISFNGCNGGPNQLQGSATQTVGALSYAWTPSGTLNNAAISNPSATNTTTTTYTMTVTDADNCTAQSTVTVSILSGTAGLWTGAENTDWFNCQNWAGGSVPTSATDVVIPDVTNDPDIASGAASCRNITLSAAGSVLNMSGAASQLSVSGNVVNNGAITSIGAVAFVGTTAQSITGATAFQNVTINNAAGVILNSNITVNGTLTLQNGTIQTQSNILSVASSSTGAVNRSGSGHIIGNLQRSIALGTTSYTFHVGDAVSYSPVSLNINNVTSSGNITVKSIPGDHPQLASSGLDSTRSVNRYYSILNASTVFTNYTATFNFVAGDRDAGLTTANMLIGNYNGGWSYPTVANPTSTSIQATAMTTFGEMALAECKIPAINSVTGGGQFCLGGGGLPVGVDDSELGVSYSLTRNSSVTVGSTMGTGDALSFGNQLLGGTYTITGTSEAGSLCSSSMSGNASIVILDNVTPAVSIAASSTVLCEGNSVTFTATPQFGGSAPVYQWKVNGSNVGANSNTYSSSSLVNGDVVICEMTSNEACPSPVSATSNSITLTVLPNGAPTISISAPSGTTICAGDVLNFTSSVTFEGNQPTYDWHINGVSAGTGASFSTFALANGNQVTCVITSDYLCATTPTASSNTLIIAVTTPPQVDAGNNMTSCGTTPYTFANGATNSNTSSIAWSENGAGSITSGANTLTPTYTPDASDLGTTVTFTLTGLGNGSCAEIADNVTLEISALSLYYVDADGDGFGNPLSSPTLSCTPIAGRAANNTDCCDSNANVNPMCEWWADEDSDGTGSFIYDEGCLPGVSCSSATWPSQLIPYYPQAPANGGQSYVTDCNDVNSAVGPGNIELCDNLVDDNCNTTIDEGCSGINNDGFISASLMNINTTGAYYPNCQNVIGSVLDADISGEGNPSNVVAGGGRDSWYRFVAPSTATRITVIPNGFNAVIELRTAAHPVGQIDVENANSAVGGTEIMNVSGLTIGQTYYVAIRNYDATSGGTFTLCVSPLMPSGCSTSQPLGGYSLCTSFKAVFRGAASYTFNFTGAGGTAPIPFVTTSATSANGLISLSNSSLALRNGGVYNIRVDVNYSLQNGAGVTDPTITILGTTTNCLNRTIAAAPLLEVRSTQRCPVTLFRSSYLSAAPVAGNSSACGAISYNYRFTRVANCAGTAIPGVTPFVVSSTSTFLSLYVAFPNGIYPLPNLGFWKVEIAPVFSYGATAYGPARVIQVNNTAASSMLSEMPQEDERAEVIQRTVSVFPNPGDGQRLIVSTDTESVITQWGVTDELGRKIEGYQVTPMDGLRYELSFNNTLANGLYFVAWESQGQRRNVKWIVNR